MAKSITPAELKARMLAKIRGQLMNAETEEAEANKIVSAAIRDKQSEETIEYWDRVADRASKKVAPLEFGADVLDNTKATLTREENRKIRSLRFNVRMREKDVRQAAKGDKAEAVRQLELAKDTLYAFLRNARLSPPESVKRPSKKWLHAELKRLTGVEKIDPKLTIAELMPLVEEAKKAAA